MVWLYSFFNLGTKWGWIVNATPQLHCPQQKTRYLLYKRLGGLQGRSRRMRKISPPLGFDPRKVQPVAAHRKKTVPQHNP